MSFSSLRALLWIDPLIVLATSIMGTVNLAAALFGASGRFQLKIARLWSRMLLAVSGVRVTVEGLEKIDPEASYVFVSNHLSYMDTPVVLAFVPAQFRFLAKAGLFKVPFIGSHLKRAGHIPVPREDPRAALKTLAEAARTVQEKKISLLVFPEGGRSATGRLKPFKEGAAYLGIKAGVPLVPICMKGTYEILPLGSGHVKPGLVKLVIGDPIPTSDLTTRDRSAINKLLYERVAEMSGANPEAADAPHAGRS
jgi:1-acyl-sn-glycerol-3-phosphate acyltransferase